MNDTLIFLVLAGIALIFKWLTKQASNENEKPSPPSQPNEPPPEPETRDETERIRRFLEALGAPAGTPPPPPVRPRPVVPRKVITPRAASPSKRSRPWEPLLPPLTTAPPPVPRTEDRLPPPPVLIPPATPAPVVLPLPSAPPVARRPRSDFSLGEFIRNRDGLRQVILLREILGPPRGLQDLGGLGRL